METGIAIGGPRDGVKLSAGPSWDGRVKDIRHSMGAIERYFPGRYRWVERVWLWLPEENHKLSVIRSPRWKGHNKKP